MKAGRLRRTLKLFEIALDEAEDEVTKEIIKREIRTLIKRLEGIT